MSAEKPKAGSAEELDAQFPEERIVSVRIGPDAAGKYETVSLTVSEMNIGQRRRVRPILKPYMAELVSGVSPYDLVDEYPDAADAALALAIGWPVDRIAQMNEGSWWKVAIAVYETNKDFFTQLLVRHVSENPETTSPPTLGDGEMPLPSSAGTESLSLNS